MIWRLLPTGSGKLIGEERDIESKSVSFFCINQFTGEVLWERRAFGPQWWIGIEAVHREMLYLHGFATPELPGHKMVIGVDILTGTRSWSSDELKFILAADDLVFASKDAAEGELLFELNYRTGAILRLWGNNHQVVKEARAKMADETGVRTEFPVTLGSVTRSLYAGVLPANDLTAQIEGIDHDEHVVLNFHERTPRSTPEETRMDNVLVIVNKKKNNIVFRDVLNAGVAAIVPESFFIQEGMLYYIKNRKSLHGIRLQ
ncbi:MAG: DUF4905 domain-containing protein [Bacteroidota bacterium]